MIVLLSSPPLSVRLHALPPPTKAGQVLGPCLLGPDADGEWAVGEWNGEGWYGRDGFPLSPRYWGLLPTL